MSWEFGVARSHALPEPCTQAVEQTIQNLIGSGMDPKTDNNPYNGFIYTSFQVGSYGYICLLTPTANP